MPPHYYMLAIGQMRYVTYALLTLRYYTVLHAILLPCCHMLHATLLIIVTLHVIATFRRHISVPDSYDATC
jgi:hypothetical protein